MTNKKKTLLIISTVFFLFLFLPLLADSGIKAQSVSLSISPPIFEAALKPGEQVKQNYLLKNEGAKTQISISVIPFKSQDLWGNVSLKDALSEYDPLDYKYWFTIQKPDVSLGEKFTISQGETKEIVLAIKIPFDTPSNDYYFTILFETEAEAYLADIRSYTKARIGSNILLSISGDGVLNKKAKVAAFQAPKLVDSFSPIRYKILIENVGNAFLKPEGKITIIPSFGKVFTLTLAPQNIITGSKREISCLEKEKLVKCSLDNTPFVGIYNATLSFKTDPFGKNYTAKTTTIAFPFFLSFALASIFLILKIILKKLKKKS